MGIIANIKVKITVTEVNQAVGALAELDTNIKSPWHAATVSILELVLEKLLKKQIAKRHDINPFKIELPYHEAYFLKEYLLKYNTIMDRYYVQTLIDKLDQKLA